MKVRNVKRFSLKMLSCSARMFPVIVRLKLLLADAVEKLLADDDPPSLLAVTAQKMGEHLQQLLKLLENRRSFPIAYLSVWKNVFTPG